MLPAWIRRHVDENPGDEARLVQPDISHTNTRLPLATSMPSYRICSVATLQPKFYKTTMHLNKILLPINIIVVEVLHTDGSQNTFAASICKSFDISVCAIELTVEEHLQFNYKGYGTALEDLRSHRLRLNTTAFSRLSAAATLNDYKSALHRQMSRIWKYIMRGFSWQGDTGPVCQPSVRAASTYICEANKT